MIGSVERQRNGGFSAEYIKHGVCGRVSKSQTGDTFESTIYLRSLSGSWNVMHLRINRWNIFFQLAAKLSGGAATSPPPVMPSMPMKRSADEFGGGGKNINLYSL